MSRESVEPRDPRKLIPLVQERLAPEAPAPRPARFAKVIGFAEEAEPRRAGERRSGTSARQSDSLNITEDVDMYEKIKASPKEMRDILKESSAFLQRENIRLEAESAGSKQSRRQDPADAPVPKDAQSDEFRENQDETMYNLLYQQAKVLESKLDRRNSSDT